MASRRAPRRIVRSPLAVAVSVAAALILAPGAGHSQSIDDVREELERLNHEAVVVVEEYNVAAEQLKAAETELRVVQERAAARQEELNRLLQQMGVYTAMAYRNGGVDETLQLLTTDDPSEFLQRAATLDQLSGRQADALRQVQTARQELEQTQRQVSDQLELIDRTHDELKAKKEEIERKQRATTALLDQLTDEQRAAINEPSEELPTNVAASGRAQIAVDFATAQLGEPYVWGAAGPDSWDCSGLTMMAWRAAGVSLPHSSAMQINYGTRVSKSELQPGDLVFFYSPISHVGIYIGDGKMIAAPKPGDVVKVSLIEYQPFAGATRPG